LWKNRVRGHLAWFEWGVAPRTGQEEVSFRAPRVGKHSHRVKPSSHLLVETLQNVSRAHLLPVSSRHLVEPTLSYAAMAGPPLTADNTTSLQFD